MKTRIQLIMLCIILIPFYYGAKSQDKGESPTPTSTEALKLASSPELTELANTWAEAYNQTEPSIRIDVSGNVQELSRINSGNTIALLQGNIPQQMQEAAIIVGRHIIVPVINISNPYLAELKTQGISPEKLSRALLNPENTSWGDLLGREAGEKVNLLAVESDKLISDLASFSDQEENKLSIKTVIAEDALSRVKQDPFTIAFCNINDIKGSNGNELADMLALLPIDKNGNGKIDPVEDIYSDLSQLTRGIWIGKYPHFLYSNIYALSNTHPLPEGTEPFLRWLLSEGQSALGVYGFSTLGGLEERSGLARLESTQPVTITQGNNASSLIIPFILLAAIVLLGFVLRFIINTRSRKISIQAAAKFTEPVLLDENRLRSPNGLFYDKTHTWAFMEKDGLVSVGLDDFMQHIIGPIDRLVLKKPGEQIRKGDPLFSIMQKGKQLNIYSPVSGTIRKQNDQIVKDSSVLNTDPYTTAWVYSIEPSNWNKESQLLHLAQKYRTWLSGEFSRVKDFLSTRLMPENREYAYVTLQDGGELCDGVLSAYGPETWEDFQTEVLDPVR